MNQVFGSRLIKFLNGELQYGLGVFHFDRTGRDGGSGRANFLDGRSQSRTVIPVFQPTSLHFSKGTSGTVCIRH